MSQASSVRHAQRLKQALGMSLHRTRDLALMLLKALLPYYILTELIKHSGLLGCLSSFMAPLMKFWGLPGEASAVLVAGALGGIYAAAAVIVPLGLSGGEITLLGFMVSIAHALPLEGAIVRELLPGSFWYISLFRLALALISGWLLAPVLL